MSNCCSDFGHEGCTTCKSIAGRKWLKVIEELEKTEDKILVALFKLATIQSINDEKKLFFIMIPECCSFYKKRTEEEQDRWMPAVHKVFGDDYLGVPWFYGEI